jgi:hypothetical protein
MTHKDITGQKLGKWTAIKHVGSDKTRNAMWECVNESGEKRDISANHLMQYLRLAKNRCVRPNRKIFYLGSLCKYGHEHKNTGKSQRYRISGGCTVCTRLRLQIANEKRRGKKVSK